MENVYLKRLRGLLPDRAEVGPNAWCQGARAASEWLQHLPLGHPEAHAQRLLDGLREMNDTRIDPARRLQGLETLRLSLANAIAAFGRQIRDETFPLPPNRMHIGATMQSFERELVAGYLRVVCDLAAADGSVSFLRRSAAALALIRAIAHQSARLRIAYQTHSAPQVGVWQSLHDMFRYAVSAGCDAKAHADPLMQGIKFSARGAYTQALLHAFAQPYHFIPAHNIELIAALPVLASLCEIRPGTESDGAIAFCTEGDHAPPLPPRGRQVAADSLWLLDVGALVRALQAGNAAAGVMVQVESRLGRAELRADFAERLVTAWSGRIEREFPRSLETREFDTIVGLQSVHATLCGMGFESFNQCARPFDDDGRSAIFAHAPDAEQARRSRARLLDRGLGGWRVRWNAGQDLRARVGELIALAPADDEQHDWIVGILRWLRVDALGAVEAGVEMLGRDAAPVSVASVDAKGIVRPPMRGLLVVPPKSDGGKVEPYIAVPHLFDREAMAVEMLHFEGTPNQDNARLQTISDMRIRSSGDLYLRIVLPLPLAGADASAANDDAHRVLQFPTLKPHATS